MSYMWPCGWVAETYSRSIRHIPPLVSTEPFLFSKYLPPVWSDLNNPTKTAIHRAKGGRRSTPKGLNSPSEERAAPTGPGVYRRSAGWGGLRQVNMVQVKGTWGLRQINMVHTRGPHWTGSREDSPDGCSLNNCSYKGVVKSEFIIYGGIVPK